MAPLPPFRVSHLARRSTSKLHSGSHDPSTSTRICERYIHQTGVTLLVRYFAFKAVYHSAQLDASSSSDSGSRSRCLHARFSSHSSATAPRRAAHQRAYSSSGRVRALHRVPGHARRAAQYYSGSRGKGRFERLNTFSAMIKPLVGYKCAFI